MSHTSKLHITVFYRSGFNDAVAVIVDGAGTFIDLQTNTGEPKLFGKQKQYMIVHIQIILKHFTNT